METSKIRIFESISLLSKLMPYYGSSHEGFLLLSLLSKIIRDNLLEHYPEYRAFMLKYAKVMNDMRYELLEMKLPFDLFQFPKLDVYYEEDAEFFVVLIRKLTNKEGLYFGEHYMSEQICFEKIYVQPKYIPALHPHIESLNSIKVFPFGGQDLSVNHSLLDLIVLADIFDFGEKLKTCFFIDSELKEINPIYGSFKKISGVYFRNYEEAFEKLNILKQASIKEIEDINFRGMMEEKAEQITNQLLNYKIHTLNLSDLSCESISNQALENISKINPLKLYLPYLSSISIFFRIILYLREDINVSFGSVSELTPLKFEKTVVLFKTKNNVVKAYCDKIGFTFGKNSNQENILFQENYVCVSNLETINIENFKRENLITGTPLEGLSLGDLNNKSCILIPRNNLSCIKLRCENISNIFENETNVIDFKSLSLKTKIIIELFSMDDLAELNKFKEHFPEHSVLAIDFYDSDIEDTNFDETLLLAILSKFKLSSLVVDCRYIDENIAMILLQMPSMQETLEHLSVYSLNISKFTSVIELLVEFKRIKTVTISWNYSLNEDELEECKLEIKQFEKEMKKKHSEIEINMSYE